MEDLTKEFSLETMGHFLSVLRNISIFGRNSWVSKVLAHEMSDKVEKNWIFKFVCMMNGGFN